MKSFETLLNDHAANFSYYVGMLLAHSQFMLDTPYLSKCVLDLVPHELERLEELVHQLKEIRDAGPATPAREANTRQTDNR